MAVTAWSSTQLSVVRGRIGAGHFSWDLPVRFSIAHPILRTSTAPVTTTTVTSAAGRCQDVPTAASEPQSVPRPQSGSQRLFSARDPRVPTAPLRLKRPREGVRHSVGVVERTARDDDPVGASQTPPCRNDQSRAKRRRRCEFLPRPKPQAQHDSTGDACGGSSPTSVSTGDPASTSTRPARAPTPSSGSVSPAAHALMDLRHNPNPSPPVVPAPTPLTASPFCHLASVPWPRGGAEVPEAGCGAVIGRLDRVYRLPRTPSPGVVECADLCPGVAAITAGPDRDCDCRRPHLDRYVAAERDGGMPAQGDDAASLGFDSSWGHGSSVSVASTAD